MAASSTGPTGRKIKLVQLTDAANIQVALNNVVYGTDSTPSTIAGIDADSLYGTLAPLASPALTGTATVESLTASGTVTLPSTTSVGTVSSTEIGYLDGVTSAIQTQFDDIAKTDNFWFGDGSDGTTIISSGTTTLTRDMYYENLQLTGTGKLNPNGFRIFVRDTLSLSSASSDAITFTPTSATAYDTSAYYGKSSYGLAAADVTTPTSFLTAAWVSAAGGGNGPTSTPTGGISWRRPSTTFYAPFATGTLNTGAGGSGGANSINATPAKSGGIGGVGGSGAFIYAKNIALGTSNANDGIISFVGGAGSSGANSASGTSDVTGAGGGGGGQGGIVYMVYKTVTGSMASGKFLVNCSGGNGGNGGTATGGTPRSDGLGGQGGASGLIVFCNIKSGTLTVPANAATLPTAPTTSTGGTGRTYKATPA